jgi:beta-phosphoglucomutase-like phosphatase (HAD superfamily)
LRLQAIVFDVDGTIADTEETHRQAFNQAFQAHGLQWHWDPALYAELLEVCGGKERIAHYLDTRVTVAPGDARQLIAALHATKTRAYRELIQRGEARARAGVHRLMREARAAGMRLAIASTTSLENIEPLFTATFGRGTFQWLHAIATGDMARHKKPAPDIYRVVLEMLDLDAGEAVAIEDSAAGLRAAKAAGLYTVATPNRWTQSQDFSAADLLIDSLADPDHPLSAAQAQLVGCAFLTLEQLGRLHASAALRGA